MSTTASYTRQSNASEATIADLFQDLEPILQTRCRPATVRSMSHAPVGEIIGHRHDGFRLRGNPE